MEALLRLVLSFASTVADLNGFTLRQCMITCLALAHCVIPCPVPKQRFQTFAAEPYCAPSPPCRDHGPRADRNQTRLLWLVEALGMERWVGLIEAAMGPGTQLRPRVEVRAGGGAEWLTGWLVSCVCTCCVCVCVCV